MKTRFTSLTIYNAILLACDIAVVLGAFFLGLWLTGWSDFLWGNNEAIFGLIILSLATISFFQSYHLYNYHFLFSRKEHLKNLAKSFCWSALTLSIIIFIFDSAHLVRDNFSLFLITLSFGALVLLFLSRYFWGHFLNFLLAFALAIVFVGITGLTCVHGLPAFMIDKVVISICFLLAIILLTLNRLFLVHIVFYKWVKQYFRRQVVIVGSDKEATKISQHIVDNNAPFWIAGIVGNPIKHNGRQTITKNKLGEIGNLSNIIKQFNIDDIIITDDIINQQRLVSILDFCTTAGINAWFSPKMLPIIDIKLRRDNFCGLPMILLCSQKKSVLFNRIKHATDILITVPAMILLSPLFLFIALAIKRDSVGPVFYKFKAIGENGKAFQMYKFRSMSADSDNQIHQAFVSKLIKGEISKEEGNEKPLKIVDDPRVTKVGKFLRKYSLDELPQLINVLQGTISLVGPRPCLLYEFEMYQDWYKKRTAVRPGITGLWQITGRSEVAFEEMILLDFYYVYNRSLPLDLNIIFETIFVVLGKKGGY